MWRPLVVFESRLRGLFVRRRREREAEQEIEMHLELLAARYVQQGNTPAEARRLARAKFGGVVQIQESLRDLAGFPMLESILHDVRYAARSLVRQPGTTTLAVGTLALGLGVNTAVLAVAYGVLWRPLPYPDADRLVTVTQVYGEEGYESGVRLDRIEEWNRRLGTMRVVGHVTRERVVRGAGPTRVMEVASVTGEFFEVLGAPAAQGVAPRFGGGDGRAVIADRRLRVLPAAGFAALALAVAMVGLFGALARAVAERRHELAVRAAVGASPGRLVRLVLRSAFAVTGAGLAAGLLAAAATGRGLASLLYGVGPFDPATFAAAAATVVFAALAATAIPARRAARLDPMTVLRAD